MADRTIAVIGNGIIGHGIAEIFAGAGWQVRLIGRSKASLDGAIAKISASLEAFQKHGLVSPKQRAAGVAFLPVVPQLVHSIDLPLHRHVRGGKQWAG